ncbi:hypothetical protein BC332_12701 [Capsicum chinense]|nr:hypothetical protein BC332_12701 [Capsicum chinense]
MLAAPSAALSLRMWFNTRLSASASKLEESDEEDTDDWLKEENTEITGTSKTSMSLEDDEDVSFGDLEEDDSDMLAKSKKVVYSSDKDSQDWVQFKKSTPDLSRDTSSVNQIGSVKENVQNSHSKESNDWLDIDDLENMWDLTPDTDLLKELPEEYTFETALADLIVGIFCI